jgi:hypothetical protein
MSWKRRAGLPDSVVTFDEYPGIYFETAPYGVANGDVQVFSDIYDPFNVSVGVRSEVGKPTLAKINATVPSEVGARSARCSFYVEADLILKAKELSEPISQEWEEKGKRNRERNEAFRETVEQQIAKRISAVVERNTESDILEIVTDAFEEGLAFSSCGAEVVSSEEEDDV